MLFLSHLIGVHTGKVKYFRGFCPLYPHQTSPPWTPWWYIQPHPPPPLPPPPTPHLSRFILRITFCKSLNLLFQMRGWQQYRLKYWKTEVNICYFDKIFLAELFPDASARQGDSTKITHFWVLLSRLFYWPSVAMTKLWQIKKRFLFVSSHILSKGWQTAKNIQSFFCTFSKWQQKLSLDFPFNLPFI